MVVATLFSVPAESDRMHLACKGTKYIIRAKWWWRLQRNAFIKMEQEVCLSTFFYPETAIRMLEWRLVKQDFHTPDGSVWGIQPRVCSLFSFEEHFHNYIDLVFLWLPLNDLWLNLRHSNDRIEKESVRLSPAFPSLCVINAVDMSENSQRIANNTA